MICLTISPNLVKIDETLGLPVPPFATERGAHSQAETELMPLSKWNKPGLPYSPHFG